MKCEKALLLLKQADAAFNETADLLAVNPDAEPYIAKYLTVYVSGIYENIIKAIVNEMAARSRINEIINYVERSVAKNFRNPDMGNIKNLVQRFNGDWKSDVGGLSPRSRDSLDSIVNNKNAIAHGESSNITYKDIRTYYRASLPIIEKIDELFLTAPTQK